MMAFVNQTDEDWAKWGQTNPYFGVINDPKFLNANLNEASLEEFFAVGEQHVRHVFDVIRARVARDFQPRRVLDFGCGVGRLLIPLARRSREAVGVDVAEGMLEVARKNCADQGVAAVRLLPAGELPSLPEASFDLVHSFIVFQHIPVRRGEAIFRKLIALLKVGGVGVVHFTFSQKRSALRRTLLALRSHSRLVHGLANVAKGHPFRWPLMQMNEYSMNRLFDILMDMNCGDVHIEFLDDGGFHGAILYFQRRPETT